MKNKRAGSPWNCPPRPYGGWPGPAVGAGGEGAWEGPRALLGLRGSDLFRRTTPTALCLATKGNSGAEQMEHAAPRGWAWGPGTWTDSRGCWPVCPGRRCGGWRADPAVNHSTVTAWLVLEFN